MRVNAGFANHFSALETVAIGAGAAYGIDYDFAGGLGTCSSAIYADGCATDNGVLGGFVDGGGSAVRYVARFQEGARRNTVRTGLVRGVALAEHDQEQEVNGDSGNRLVVGATQIVSVVSPGSKSTPFVALTTADPFTKNAKTRIRAERPSTSPNEPIVLVPNQSGAIQTTA